jgi:hypothetical protein
MERVGRPAPFTSFRGVWIMSIPSFVSKQAEEKRRRLRESLWPNSDEGIWKASKERGYFCAPRSLPLLLRLLSDKKIVKLTNCGRVYLDLLAHHWGQGIVEITSEGEHAYYSNYSTERSIRTWRERIDALERVGLIRTKPKPNQRIGYVLLLHPHPVAKRLHDEGLVDELWWSTYTKRMLETGGSRPVAKPAGTKVSTIKRAPRKTTSMISDSKPTRISARIKR